MLKLFLNSLYGKFGQDRQASEFRKIHKDRLVDAPYRYEVIAEEGDYKFIYRTVDRKKYPPATNYFWPAYVCAYARIELHKKLVEIASDGGEPLYCDTDSVIYRGGISPERMEGLGDWSCKDTALAAEIVAPKTYRLFFAGHELDRAKGIPNKAARQAFETKIAVWQAPLQLREAWRSGETINKWVTKQRRLLQTYNKRKVLRDGRTEPIRI